MTTPDPASLTPTAATAALHAHLKEPMDGDSMPDVQLVAALLDAGADINASDAEGLPPLLRCLSWRYANFDPDVFKTAAHEMLDLLLARGADLNAVTPDGKTHADLATNWKDAQLASKKLGREAYRRSESALAAKIPRICTSWPKPGESATLETKQRLISACTNGAVDEVIYLLHIHPDAASWQIDHNNHKGVTSMIAGICGGKQRATITKLFIEAGAPIDQRDGTGRSALHFAAICDADCVTLLMQAGANEKLVDHNDHTPLERAQARAPSQPAMLLAMQAAIDERRRSDADLAAQDAAQIRLNALRKQHKQAGGRFKL